MFEISLIKVQLYFNFFNFSYSVKANLSIEKENGAVFEEMDFFKVYMYYNSFNKSNKDTRY